MNIKYSFFFQKKHQEKLTLLQLYSFLLQEQLRNKELAMQQNLLKLRRLLLLKILIKRAKKKKIAKQRMKMH